MVAIKINNEFLDLLPDTSISLEINNPLFSEDIFPGSFSLPFSLPASPKNRKLLGYPELIELSTKPKLQYEGVELHVENMLYKTGVLIFRGISSGLYRVNFQTEISLLDNAFNKLKLHDLNHPNIIIADWSEERNTSPWATANGCKFIDMVLTSGATVPNPLIIAVNGETMEIEDASAQVRLQYIADQLVLLDLGVGFSFGTVTNQAVAGISFYTLKKGLYERLEVDMKEEKSLVNSTWEVADNWLPLYYAALQSGLAGLQNNNLFSDFVFPTYHNPLFYEGKERNFTPTLNNYIDDVGNSIMFAASGGRRDGIVPMFFIHYIVRMIEETTGVTVIGDWKKGINNIQNDAFFFNNHSLDFFESAYDNTFDIHYLNEDIEKHVIVSEINPRLHIPNLSITEFFIEQSKIYNFGFDFNQDNQTLEVFYKKNILLQSGYIPMPNCSPEYEIEYGDPTGNGITLGYKWSDKDVRFAEEEGAEMAPIVIGDGTKKIESSISSVFSRITRVEGGLIELPVISEKGTWYPDVPTTLPRMALYHGFRTSDGVFYNFSTSNYSNFNAFGLVWSGVDGLYEGYWREWIDYLLRTKEVKRTVYMNVVELLNYNFKNKYRIDQVRYFFRRLSFSVSTRRGLGPVTVDKGTVD